MTKKKYKVLDLFCGCGGLSKGFEMAGYNIVLGVDFNEPALKTYAYNHHESKTLCGDLSSPKTFDIIDNLLDGKEIDVIIGGPPCQGFSLTGPRQFDDERNKLYLAMIETVRRYKPKAFLIENVPQVFVAFPHILNARGFRQFKDFCTRLPAGCFGKHPERQIDVDR